MTKMLSEEELKQVCRSLVARLSQSVKEAKSDDEEKPEILRLVLREIRKASGVNPKKNVYPTPSGKEVDAYWYEIKQTLSGSQDDLVSFDYRRIIKEELLDKIHQASS